MALVPDPTDVLTRIRREVDRTTLRARNGLKVLADLTHPEVGCTPRELVWQRDKVRLFRYHSEQRRWTPPVLLVMSLVSKPYVFDLRPGNSFVATLLERGFDVYVLEWGIPDAVEAGNSYETYCDEYLPLAVQAVIRSSGADGVSIYGYCLGGVLSLLSAAANPEMPVANLAMMATPIDFQCLGAVPALLREGRIALEELIDETGNVPAKMVLSVLKTFNPTGDLTSYATLLQHLDSREYIAAHEALVGWVHDHIPFPGTCFRQTVEWFIRDDRLVQGVVPFAGRDVDVRSIHCPVLNVVADADHLITPDSNRPIVDLISQLDDLHLKAGHVGLIIGGTAQRRSIPQIADWLAEHSDELGPVTH